MSTPGRGTDPADRRPRTRRSSTAPTPSATSPRPPRRSATGAAGATTTVLGTLNFIDDAKRARAAALVRRGASFSLSQPFDMNGPQQGWRRRTNPVHTMLDTGTDAAAGTQGFPHGIGGADDVIAMPLQCSTQWDGLGHIFDHGMAWNGRPAGSVVTSDGDLVTGIEHAASAIVGRGVLLDLGRFLRPEASDDGPAGRAARRLRDHDRRARGVHRRPGRDERRRPRRHRARAHRAATPARSARAGTATPAGRAPACRSRPPAGCTAPRSPRSPPTRGASRCGPTSSTTRSSRCTRSSSPTSGLTIGEMWDLEALAADCAADGVHEFLLVGAPLPITGAVGSPVNPIALK